MQSRSARTPQQKDFSTTEEAQPKCPVILARAREQEPEEGNGTREEYLLRPRPRWPYARGPRSTPEDIMRCHSLSADRSPSGVVPAVIMAYLRLGVKEEAERVDEVMCVTWQV